MMQTSQERKKFFSMDLIERMIRVEQRVSAHFGKIVPYNKTEYYQSLTEKEREDFESWHKNKNRRKAAILAALILPLIFVLALNIKLTGNVINNYTGADASFLSIIIGAIFLIAAVFFLLARIRNKAKNKKYAEHVSVLFSYLKR